MIEIAYILVSCCLFIHLGLGQAMSKIIRVDFVLFRCPKCLAFWSILGYLLLSNKPIISSIAIAFVCAYLALWIDLLLAIISEYYEKIYKGVGAEEPKNNRTTKANRNQNQKIKNG
jgi:hypothetical protein